MIKCADVQAPESGYIHCLFKRAAISVHSAGLFPCGGGKSHRVDDYEGGKFGDSTTVCVTFVENCRG
eukprot:SAG11_NODE_12207_length_715_cov_1.957792_1_plen_67_part_00